MQVLNLRSSSNQTVLSQMSHLLQKIRFTLELTSSIKAAFFLIFIFTSSSYSRAQCDPTVPLYNVDLTGHPDTTWTLLEIDADDRLGQCCGVPSNNNCIQFILTLDPNAAGVFFDYDGAGAFGSLNWQIGCGAPASLKDTICITGVGPHVLTFCKPGSDGGNYFMRSVAKPTFPSDQAVPLGCERPLEVLGVTANSVTWTSIAPGAPGSLDSLLSCNNCLTPTFTPYAVNQPSVSYEVCGYPLLDYCVGTFVFCDTVTFTIQDSLLLNLTPSTPTFCSGGSATVNATATGGDGVYSYFWYDNSLNLVGTGASFSTGIAGTYTCEVRDGNYDPLYCGGTSQTISISETLPPVVDAGVDQVVCASSPIFSLTGSITNATGGIWTGASGVYTPSNTDLITSYSPTVAEINSGSITFTLTSTGAGSGCVNNSDMVTIFFADTISTNIQDTLITCNNETILIDPIVRGGVEPYSYSWNVNSIDSSVTVGAGSLCLIITDAIGCSYNECILISEPTPLILGISSTDATVDGASDGTATVVPSGGTAPYTYLWSSGGTTALETGLPYGVYTVTVTDANGCQSFGSVVVNEPRCNGFDGSTTSTNVLCNSDSSGTASVSIVGGTAPFVYSWNDYGLQTNPIAVNLPAGVYTIEVTDFDNCVFVAVATILEPSALNSVMSHTDAATIGGNDGSASVSVSGGASPYTYSWSTLETTPAISNLTAGMYFVTILDANGCSLSDSVYINEPPCNGFTINTGTVDVSCNGGSDGQANAIVANGLPSYNYLWSTGATTSSVAGLSAGLYTVQVTDSQGCFTFHSFGILEPSPLSVGLSVTNTQCNGTADGTIDATVSGGTFPSYFFQWSSGQQTEDIVNLSPGTYMLTITDENGCTASSSTTITEPNVLSTSFVTTDVTCFGGTDGAIDVTVIGGSLPYSFAWSNGATTEDLTGIDIGGYILSLTDGNGCAPASQLSTLITQPDELQVDSVVTGCPGQGLSEVPVIVYMSGGMGNYQISYDNGVTYNALGDYDDSLTNASSYDIMVQDVNGCLSPVPFTINLDTNVYASQINYGYCYASGQSTELVTVVPVGGDSGPYQISLDNGITWETIGQYAFNLPIASTYNILVRDLSGCISVTYNELLPDSMSTITSVYSNYNGSDISCFGFSNGEVLTSTIGGSGPYSYLWNNGQTDSIATNLSANMYLVTVTDTNGCSVIDSVMVDSPLPINASLNISSNFNGQDISCYGLANGEVSSVVSGGTGSYTYVWSNGQNTAIATGLVAGTYSFSVTDLNGCSANGNITLTQPDSVHSSAVITPVSCNGGNDGFIDLTVVGGTMPYSYQWSNGSSNEDPVNLPSGTYQVIVTDVNSCIDTLYNLVVDPTAITLSTTAIDVLCKGDANGSVDLTAVGGTPPYLFSWNSGETSEDIFNVIAGIYTVTVTDGNGCFTDITDTIFEPDSLLISLLGTNVSCYGQANGEIQMNISGGTEPYSINWSNGQFIEDIIDLTAGMYNVIIIDDNGCSQSDTLEITQPDSLWGIISSSEYFHGHNVSLNGELDASIDVQIFGGTMPYTYLWSTGDTTQNLDNLGGWDDIEENYSVEIIDAQGCYYYLEIDLTQPYDIDLPTACSPNGDGKNDFFFIRGIEAYPKNKLYIYNRWGSLVYNKNNYANTWDGQTNSGSLLPDATYFVILELDNGVSFSGYIDLRRK